MPVGNTEEPSVSLLGFGYLSIGVKTPTFKSFPLVYDIWQLEHLNIFS